MNWNIDSNINLTDFFKENITYFSNFGGDTQKLALQCKLIHSEQNFDYLFNNDFSLIITQDELNKGFEEYKRHNVY
jgi:hypothetical protein